MLRSTKELLDLSIVAQGDAIGDVKDLYFDDEAWAIRYLVVDTGSWLSRRKVLISPMAAGTPDWAAKLLPVSLTREQVRKSPHIDTDMPITRQHETDNLDHYGYPHYWGLMGGGMGMSPAGGYSGMLMPGVVGDGAATSAEADMARVVQIQTDARRRDQDPHLRSCNAVVEYQIQTSDGEIGHVYGLLVDEESWAVRYLVVSTGNWWKGHELLVAPQWIQRVSWADQTVAVDMTRDTLKQAPWYDPAAPLSREMEIAVYKHYGRAAYWPAAAPPADRVVPSQAGG